MTADDTQNYKIDQLGENIKRLDATLEKLVDNSGRLAAEVSTLRRDYSQIPHIVESVNSIERELAANRVWIKLLGGAVSAALLGVVTAIINMVVK